MNRELDAAAWSAWIPANHAGLRWEGRLRFDDEGSAVFDWAQVRLHAFFSGDRLAVYAKTADNYLDVVVDGKRVAVLGRKPRVDDAPSMDRWLGAEQGDGRVFVLKGLGAGRHQLLLAKRTGPNIGTVHFQGLRLAAGESLASPPPALARRIEFLGDSLTNGYGNEGPGLHCTELPPYENSSRSWARLVADALGAEAHLLAYSGYGAVRNYGDKEAESKDPFPFYYPRTVLAEKQAWNRADFRPQVVVLFLGTNDYSTEPAPSAESFMAGYRRLMAAAREGRSGLSMLCLYPTEKPVLAQRVKAAVELERAQGFSVRVLGLLAPKEEELACDWHPKTGIHEKWALAVEEELKDLMKWSVK